MKIVIFENLLKSEKEQAVEEIISGGYPRQEFFFVNMLATGITVLGLIQDNIPIIIGGMILAPMLYPLLTMSLGITTKNLEVFWRAIRTTFAMTVFNLAIAVGLSLIFKSQIVIDDLVYVFDIETNIFGALVAFISGVAAAFLISKEEIKQNFAAVAITVSLLPPLSSVGIGIAIWDTQVLLHSLGLFLVNMLFIILGSTILFYLMEFKNVKKEVEKTETYEEEEKERFEG